MDKVIVHSCYEAGRDGLLVAPLVGRAMHRQRRGGRGLLSIIFHESNSANREPRIKRKSLMFGLAFRVAIGNRRAEAALRDKRYETAVQKLGVDLSALRGSLLFPALQF